MAFLRLDKKNSIIANDINTSNITKKNISSYTYFNYN